MRTRVGRTGSHPLQTRFKHISTSLLKLQVMFLLGLSNNFALSTSLAAIEY